jgi:hypothetical protein
MSDGRGITGFRECRRSRRWVFSLKLVEVNLYEVIGGDVVKIGSSDLVDVGFLRGAGMVEVLVLGFQDDVLGFRT